MSCSPELIDRSGAAPRRWRGPRRHCRGNFLSSFFFSISFKSGMIFCISRFCVGGLVVFFSSGRTDDSAALFTGPGDRRRSRAEFGGQLTSTGVSTLLHRCIAIWGCFGCKQRVHPSYLPKLVPNSSRMAVKSSPIVAMILRPGERLRWTEPIFPRRARGRFSSASPWFRKQSTTQLTPTQPAS